MPDGSVSNAAAVSNTTGSNTLASCAANEISAWRFTAFDGTPQDLTRVIRFSGAVR
jgi:hypothetical protein